MNNFGYLNYFKKNGRIPVIQRTDGEVLEWLIRVAC